MIDTLEQFFASAANIVEIGVDALAVLMVGLAACDAAFRSLQNAFRPSRALQLRAIWLNFAGWTCLRSNSRSAPTSSVRQSRRAGIRSASLADRRDQDIPELLPCSRFQGCEDTCRWRRAYI